MSFRRVLTSGVAALVFITVITGTVAIVALGRASTTYDAVAHDFADDLLAAQNLRSQAELVAATSRNITPGDTAQQRRLADEVAQFRARVIELHARANDRWDRGLIRHIEVTGNEYTNAALERAAQADELLRAFDAFSQALSRFVDNEEAELHDALGRAESLAQRNQIALAFTTLLGVLLSMALAALVWRRLNRLYRSSQQAETAARREAEARQEVLAIVSHDLRNPLNTIVMGAALLAETQPGRHVERIGRAADRMTKMIEQILDTARIDAQTLVLHRTHCDARTLLDSALDMFHARAAEQRVELVCESVDAVAVDADTDRVFQILSNLIANALKFTPPGGRITASATADATDVTFAIHDTGPGIPPAQRSRLFERYWQGNEQRRGSLGLGLFICKNLVEAHGGRIWLDATPEGSRFCFTLPRARL